MVLQFRFLRLRALFGSLFVLSASAQTVAVDQLRSRLMARGAVFQLKISGIHSTADPFGHPAEMTVTDGKVSRGSSSFLHSTADVALPPGLPVQVVGVELKKQGKKDVLLITLNSRGALVPVGLVEPAGNLASESEAQLEVLVASLLILPAASGRAANPHDPIVANAIGVDGDPRLDFPPTAPGFPPMHASHAPDEGCEWHPIFSRQLGFEMLTERCVPGNPKAAKFSERPQAVLVQAENGIPEEVFSIRSKPANQPITEAIRQQFITQLPDAEARASCQPKRDQNETGGIETYTVVATGAYAQQKRFVSEDSTEQPCKGLSSDDNVSRSFLYNPSESKTRFLFLHQQQMWPYDPLSIHFLP